MVSEPDHNTKRETKIMSNTNGQPEFNLPTLKHYSEEQAWNFLREFDRTPRSVRQNQLNYYKERLNYLCIFARM